MFCRQIKVSWFSKQNWFDNELVSFSRKITSSKTKYLKVQKKLNSLTTKVYKFFLDKNYFTSNYGSQNTFVYDTTLDTLELKKT